MNLSRLCFAAVALATTLVTSGCHCGDEQHAVTISSGLDSLTVVGEGTTRRIGSVGRLTVPPTPTATFDFIFNTLEGSASGDGIVLSLSGYDPKTPSESVMLALALPVSLRPGDEYTVGRTFTVDAGLDTDPRSLGAYDLQQSNQAEAAFIIATYSFPPPVFTTNFRAVRSTGTVRVTSRENGRVELALNLSFTDAAGKTRTVTGNMHATTERFFPPCN